MWSQGKKQNKTGQAIKESVYKNDTQVCASPICLNMKHMHGYYNLFLGQNLKFYILLIMLKSKVICISICMSCMNEFIASVKDCTWYLKQSTILTTFVISLLPKYIQTPYILEGTTVIFTCVNDKTKSILL